MFQDFTIMTSHRSFFLLEQVHSRCLRYMAWLQAKIIVLFYFRAIWDTIDGWKEELKRTTGGVGL